MSPRFGGIPTTDRLSTSRSISNSAQRRRNRTSSARSSELKPSASPRSIRSLRTQFPRVPAPIPRSRAISTTGLRVSRTIRTAPALNSESNLRRVCDIAPPHRRCLHDSGGYPKAHTPDTASRARSPPNTPLNRRSCDPSIIPASNVATNAHSRLWVPIIRSWALTRG